jgi:hypothetical protein
MSYLRVSVGTWSIDLDSPQGSEIFQKVRDEGLRIFRRQPGFIDYRLMKMDARTTVAVAEWESRELGQPGSESYRAWLRDSGIFEHLTLNTYEGEIVVNSRASSERQEF